MKERELFRKEAYVYYMGQLISDARRSEKMTQSELAERVGTNKTYISRIEKGIKVIFPLREHHFGV
ncbi:hypothetical protein SDC9_105138 [bioreactor metagenome]|uniref:HTH cro/C1-type domain-containing protein n=1 Tax=bioreactor metagenome TaxID=1076179 RepID=A0A645AYR2_9ZZZZ